MVVRTVKTDILESGNIYGFTGPDWLGKFLVLNSTKFYLDKVANLIMFQPGKTSASASATWPPSPSSSCTTARAAA